MSRRLATNVVIDGTVYAGGTIPPADVAKRITNEVAWEPAPADPEPSAVVPAASKPKGKRGAKATSPSHPAASPVADQGSGTTPTGDSSGQQPPNTEPAGNADTKAWAEFAQTVGVQLPDGAGREDIKAALTERGLLGSDQ